MPAMTNAMRNCGVASPGVESTQPAEPHKMPATAVPIRKRLSQIQASDAGGSVFQ
jgi:hypothetical protein